MTPENRDGEVAQFALMDADDMLERMQQGSFTMEAALIVAEALQLA